MHISLPTQILSRMTSVVTLPTRHAPSPYWPILLKPFLPLICGPEHRQSERQTSISWALSLLLSALLLLLSLISSSWTTVCSSLIFTFSLSSIPSWHALGLQLTLGSVSISNRPYQLRDYSTMFIGCCVAYFAILSPRCRPYKDLQTDQNKSHVSPGAVSSLVVLSAATSKTALNFYAFTRK